MPYLEAPSVLEIHFKTTNHDCKNEIIEKRCPSFLSLRRKKKTATPPPPFKIRSLVQLSYIKDLVWKKAEKSQRQELSTICWHTSKINAKLP